MTRASSPARAACAFPVRKSRELFFRLLRLVYFLNYKRFYAGKLLLKTACEIVRAVLKQYHEAKSQDDK
jgi:hypothetical protein